MKTTTATKTTAKTIEKPLKRSPKGQFIEGNHEGINAGRPCEFCPQSEMILKKIDLYAAYCMGDVDDKMHPPFLEELCGYKYLNILVSTIYRWIDNDKPMPHDKKHNQELHSELSESVKRLVQYQKQFLLNHSLFNNQVSGAIFQLKANHGMIETEKRILAGSVKEPLEIIITEEDRKRDGEQ